MNRKRFNLILEFLHFTNNEDTKLDQNDGNWDRLHKVRPLINIFRDCAKLVYLFGKNLSVKRHWPYSRDTYNFNSTSRPSVPDSASNFMNRVFRTV